MITIEIRDNMDAKDRAQELEAQFQEAMQELGVSRRWPRASDQDREETQQLKKYRKERNKRRKSAKKQRQVNRRH